MMDEDRKIQDFQNCRPPPKPLFPVSSLFPVQTSSSQEPGTISKDHSENALETLTLDLKPTTLNAIIAAQKTTLDEPQQFENDRDNSLPECMKRRKSSASDFSSFDEEESMKRKKKQKKKKKKLKKAKQIYDDDEPSERNLESQVRVPEGAVFLEDIPGLKPQHAFHIDRKANKDLWHYKSVSKMHLAKYKCYRRNCLGALNILYKDPLDSKKKKHKFVSWRYYDKKAYRKILLKGLNSVSSVVSLKLSDNTESYIPLPVDPTTEEASQKTSLGSYSCLDSATSQYAQGMGSDYSKPQEENIEMSEIFEKIRSYNTKTRENPHDVELWLEFVQFQDVVAQEDKSMKSNISRLRDMYQPPRSVIEKKLSVLEKAIELNPSSLDLKLARLELYQDIWEPEKCEKAWQDLLFTYAADVDLWRKYLSNQQSRLVKFSFGKMLKLYHKCFQTVVPVLDGQVKVVSKPDDMEEKLLGLFCQYCQFLHHTGYTERAVSSFQAIIEMNLFCPTSLNLTPTRQRVESLQAFWESGVPRFGEPGAKGWTHWFDKKQQENNVYIPDIVNTDELEDKIILDELPRSLTWLKMEKIRQEAHLLPWKPDTSKGETEDSCEDLDRVVLFDDIKSAMFRMTKSDSCIRVVCSFLRFLGLSSDALDRMLSIVDFNFNNTKFDQFGITGLSQYSMLAGLQSDLNVDLQWMPPEGLVVFIRNVLLQCESFFGTARRNLFTFLRLELEVLKSGVTRVTHLPPKDCQGVKKFGKNLLKDVHNRSNLFVWNSYIRLLWACSDNMAETVSMMDVAMRMYMGSTSFSDVEKFLGLCQLCKTYCEIMLNFEPLEHIVSSSKNSPPSLDDKHQVISCLGALVENKPFKANMKTAITPAYILKMRRRFETMLKVLCGSLDSQTYAVDNDLFITFVECFALFEFSASNFHSAVDTFSLAIRQVKEKPVNVSLIQQIYSRQISFITNVMGVTVIPLITMRSVLDKALSEFPQCPHFHVVFLRIESGAYITGRLRKFYDRNLRTSTSVMVPLFYVMSELIRHQAILKSMNITDDSQTSFHDSGSVNRIRALFEHCVQLPVTSHCPLLWRLYLMFEVKYGQSNRTKGIFYRALQNCPWAKCIYMDGIAIFGDNELQEVMDLMTEEEMRVRIPLEEVDLLLGAHKEASDQPVDESKYDDDDEMVQQDEPDI
ncbi:hypothetical protein Btru_046974 [Bulinus truncatus]|nr:hypothetical protein Btru_046974 [Bulinus truncatus]